ncbi:MAG: glycosyltransferase, partial [Acidimicrobiia bacterium]
VLPVGCDLSSIPSGPKDDPPLILWNHRWDPDKDPAAFLESMTRLAATGARFGIALTGERFVQQRPGHDDAIDALGDLVVVDGYLDRRDYLDVLGRSTIVMSSAHQEFFGVSVVEAMAAGAVPILPHRLVYSERVPSDCVTRTLYRTQDEAVDLLIAAVEGGEETRSLGTRLAATVRDYDWSVVAPSYDRWLQTTVTS